MDHDDLQSEAEGAPMLGFFGFLLFALLLAFHANEAATNTIVEEEDQQSSSFRDEKGLEAAMPAVDPILQEE